MITIIKNGHLVDPAQNINGLKDILIEGGRIKAVENPGQINVEPVAQVVEAKGRLITPGLIDMHVHFREPGHEYKETLETGARAAAFGGFTSVVTMPNTSPALDDAGLIHDLVQKAQSLNSIRIWPAAAMTRGRKGEELTEYDDLKRAGAIAVTDDGSWVSNPKVMRRVLEYAKVCGLAPLSHAEDHALAKGGAMNEGRVSTRLGLPGIPAASEFNAAFRDVSLAELADSPLHICHISARGTLEVIKKAKEKGLKITGETAPHYLFLTEEAVMGYNANAKMNPPLRTIEDQEALKMALTDGTIDVIATDHAPHSILEKEVEFVDSSFGIIGLETSLALMLKLTSSGVINYQRLVELMSLRPAQILGLPLGTLQPGLPADITIINPNLEWTYTRESIRSKSRNTPFIGQKFTGKAVMTMVEGRIVYEDGQGLSV